MSEIHPRTHFGLWAMWSAPLLAGNDPRTIASGDATSAILLDAEVIAIDQDPMGAMALTVRRSETERVWRKPLANGRIAVLAVNLSDQPRDITLDWNDIGVHGRFAVRDVWAKSDGGPISTQFRTSRTAPHGSVLLVLTPTR